MNFEDEPYVRCYTRDTLTWKALEYEGQTVLLHMLRDRFDRAGVFDCRKLSPALAVTAVTGVPLAVTERGVARLIETETWELHGSRLVWPRYLEAQTCRRSDRLRQAESRKNRTEKARLQIGDSVTNRDETSRSVTRVTSCHPELSLADQISPPVSPPLGPSPTVTPPAPPPAKPAKKTKARSALPADAGWSPENLRRLRAIGRDPRAELEAFRAHHAAAGTLSASWAASLTTWVLGAEKGYGAPRGPAARAPGAIEHEARVGPERTRYVPPPQPSERVGAQAVGQAIAALRRPAAASFDRRPHEPPSGVQKRASEALRSEKACDPNTTDRTPATGTAGPSR